MAEAVKYFIKFTNGIRLDEFIKWKVNTIMVINDTRTKEEQERELLKAKRFIVQRTRDRIGIFINYPLYEDDLLEN